MRTELYWLEGPWQGRLAIMPRPRGGDWLEDEVRAWKQTGVDVVVSLLMPEENTDLDLEKEAELCQAAGLQLISFPLVDRSVPPSLQKTLNVVRLLEPFLTAGKTVAIHCRQGIGRAGLLAACLLVLAGVNAEAAFRRLSDARGCQVPETSDQRRWVVDFAGSLAASQRQA